MINVAGEIKELFSTFKSASVNAIEKLPQSGGDRIYFRVKTSDESFIATYNKNTQENETFINFSTHFKKSNCPVPEIYKINSEQTLYIQKDLGDESLLTILEKEGHTEYVYSLFQKSLRALAWLQIQGHKDLDYRWCITSKEFGKQAIVSDLLYFKYYFLDTLKIAYDKEKLIDDFDALGTYLAKVEYKYFMFRDFQSRNIMIKNDDVYFIDYQGGMKGALQYDVASLLWQAKAELSDEWKNNLLDYYLQCVEEILKKPVSRTRFISQYNGYVLIRLLQVLGTYGFRGLFERKAHFLTSIPLALRNMKWFLENKKTGIVLPEFEKVLNRVVEDEVVNRFEPLQASDSTPLTVKINSFSYKKNGIPIDETENGGGFVFDCRGILNPGRFEAYKNINGRDKSVKDFLEQETKMPEFLNSIYNLVDISVEDYIRRGFDSLMISFGCTGGCHRSVYAADALARHVRNKFHVKVELNHIEQHIKELKG
ncbi:MAG: phosphotransferase [Chitinophagaceae bacterium]|nr:phosphotransferase [Chitinophagaceae bacterium]